MPISPLDPGIHRILVPLDLDQGSECVFAHALKLALATGATLTALHVWEDPGQVVPWTGVPSALTLLQRWGVLGPEATEGDVEALGLHLEREDRVAPRPEQGIVRAVLERLPNVLVMGTHGRRGLDRLLHGSVAEAVARRSGAVTLLLPNGIDGFLEEGTGRARLGRVLFPVGGDATGLQHAVDVLEAFLQVLGVHETSIVCFHSGTDPLPELTLPAHPGWDWEAVQAGRGEAVADIVATTQASACDLVVMATRGHDSLGDLVAGSRTERVVRRVRCPVLVVPVGE